MTPLSPTFSQPGRGRRAAPLTLRVPAFAKACPPGAFPLADGESANDLTQRAPFARAGLRWVILPEALVLSDLPGCLARLTREVTP